MNLTRSDDAEQAGELTLGDILRFNAEQRPDRLAVQHPGGEVTFAELERDAWALAAALRDAGLRRGDRVGVLLENRYEFVLGFYAAGLLGAAVAAFGTKSTAAEIRHACDVAEPSAFIVSDAFRAAFDEACTDSRFAGLPVIAVAAGAESPGESFTRLLAAPRATLAPAARAQDILMLIYTSGTTGRPKAAALSHRTVLARSMAWGAVQGLGDDAAFVVWAPMSHMVSSEWVFHTHSAGSAAVIIDGFRPDEIVAAICRHNLGWLVMMPGTVDEFTAACRKREGELRRVWAVGAMADLVPQASLTELTRVLDAPYMNSYGATEIGFFWGPESVVPVGAEHPDLGKVPMPFTAFKLVDEDGAEVARGEPGELLVRGPLVFDGYWNNPAANAECFAGGWYHTGDVLVQDDHGRLNFVGRRTFMIKSGGINVYPAEIERLLLVHDRVSEAVVVGVPDAKWGEAVWAFIAADEGISDAELRDYLRATLAPYKIPKRFIRMAFEQFPRNVTGKVDRANLQRRATAERTDEPADEPAVEPAGSGR